MLALLALLYLISRFLVEIKVRLETKAHRERLAQSDLLVLPVLSGRASGPTQ
jgi:hypothetical protein